jgi:ADP-ribosylglycohydrolase
MAVHFVPVPESVLRDRIRGAWLGQMIGVSWGFPTEFYARYIWELFPEIHQVDGVPQNIYAAYEGGPIPLEKLPRWRPELINGGYTQDDLYVEVPFMETLARHGVNAGWGPLGAALARSQFPLWHANAAARRNLRAGIPAPRSGHYSNGGESDDIDWQIESDFVGLMNPGQPHSAADIAFRAGHVTNYGDGVYGGVFVATMISRAFTATSVREIAEAGRQAVPRGSKYRALLDQVFADHDRGESFGANLAALNARWGTDDRCREWGGARDPLNIDAKLNGAYILLGLLYGEGDLARSMRLTMACGQDSDCNVSSVGSVLGAFYGRDAMAASDPNWLSRLDSTRVFETTPYRLDDLVELNLELARAVVEFKGGTAPVGGVWQLPVIAAREVLILEQWPAKDNAAPVLTASVSIEEGRTVRVRARATDDDGVLAYQWFFGDLTFARGPQHLHTYRAPGSYELVAYVADVTGNTSCTILDVSIP